jgi:hypothetical protein
MKETSVVVPEEIPAIGISYNCELPGKKGLVFQTHVPQSADTLAINEVVDKIKAVADRQFAFGLLEHLKLQLEQEQKLAYDHAIRMAQAEDNAQAEWLRSNKRGEFQLGAKQLQDQKQAIAHMEESKRRIAKVERDIADAQRIVSGA